MNCKIIALVLITITGCTHEASKLIDVDGNEYRIKKYGEVLWMTENLRVEHDKNGDTITRYYPNNTNRLVEDFGLLYDYETACKICPSGWDLPTEEDWEKLFKKMDNTAPLFKERKFWDEENNINSSEFSVRPAGYGNTEYNNFFNSKTYFWAKTENMKDFAWTFIFEKEKDNIRKAEQHPTYAYSVRCIKTK